MNTDFLQFIKNEQKEISEWYEQKEIKEIYAFLT